MYDSTGIDNVINEIHSVYSSLRFTPPHKQYTVLASFFLTYEDSGTPAHKIISIATGTKCLPAIRLSTRGEVIHDSHAEVLARRGAIRWVLEEIRRTCGDRVYTSQWLFQRSPKTYELRAGVKANLYISTVPCGDASTRLLASLQDEVVAVLKDSTTYPTLHSSIASRGRDNYSRLGVLRTKPGRADSPPTLSMSCSDKIALWNAVGFQGALASRFIDPIYISTVIIGEVTEDMQPIVKGDCIRALAGRLDSVTGLPPQYTVQTPEIIFTHIPFVHSRMVMATLDGSSNSCNDSLCWVAESGRHEVYINGLKRGVSPKHRHREKSTPMVSRIALFKLYNEIAYCLGTPSSPTVSYLSTKEKMREYWTAKHVLFRENGPFNGWIKTGTLWQNFFENGNEALQDQAID
ncbi:adenosine deaminase/editase [Cyathus striatus]|nr:adenosine deaminase/editase [Cyathus striatus]